MKGEIWRRVWASGRVAEVPVLPEEAADQELVPRTDWHLKQQRFRGGNLWRVRLPELQILPVSTATLAVLFDV